MIVVCSSVEVSQSKCQKTDPISIRVANGKKNKGTKLAYVCGSSVYVQKMRVVQELPGWVPFD